MVQVDEEWEEIDETNEREEIHKKESEAILSTLIKTTAEAPLLVSDFITQALTGEAYPAEAITWSNGLLPESSPIVAQIISVPSRLLVHNHNHALTQALYPEDALRGSLYPTFPELPVPSPKR